MRQQVNNQAPASVCSTILGPNQPASSCVRSFFRPRAWARCSPSALSPVDQQFVSQHLLRESTQEEGNLVISWLSTPLCRHSVLAPIFTDFQHLATKSSRIFNRLLSYGIWGAFLWYFCATGGSCFAPRGLFYHKLTCFCVWTQFWSFISPLQT